MSEGAITFTILLIPYLIPTFIALVRQHHQRLAILALNVFLGWTLLGWVGALVWSLTKKERAPARQ